MDYIPFLECLHFLFGGLEIFLEKGLFDLENDGNSSEKGQK